MGAVVMPVRKRRAWNSGHVRHDFLIFAVFHQLSLKLASAHRSELASTTLTKPTQTTTTVKKKTGVGRVHTRLFRIAALR